MTEATIFDEPDNDPPEIVELSSVDDDDPIPLVESEDWPQPPDGWDAHAHTDEMLDDPDVTITTDDAPEPATP